MRVQFVLLFACADSVVVGPAPGELAGSVSAGSAETQQSPVEPSGQITRHQVASAFVTPVTLAVCPA